MSNEYQTEYGRTISISPNQQLAISRFVSRTYGWMPSLLVLPTVVLVYVSYRIQVGQQLVSDN